MIKSFTPTDSMQWFVYCSITLLALLATAAGGANPPPRVNRGSFWHITDFHYDPTVATQKRSCIQGVEGLPSYGSNLCDSRLELLSSALNAMKRLDSNPDFILWTGDTALHYENGIVGTEQEIVKIMTDMSELIDNAFPSAQVIASLGNHDYVPDNQLPDNGNEIYTNISKVWERLGWFNGEAQGLDTSKQYGYYSVRLSSRLVAVALNTNFYYKGNKVFEDLPDDPGNQLAALRELLSQARANSSKVLISAHVSFGVGGEGDYIYTYEKYNADFLAVIRAYADVIVGPFFGHEHINTFKLVFDESGTNAIARAFLAPSISPRSHLTIEKVPSPIHNPGVRLFKYDVGTFDILDYSQYYLDLNAANTGGTADWSELYTFTSAYNVTDLSIASVKQAAEKIRNGEKISEYLQAYYCKKEIEECEDKCRAGLACAIFEVDHDEAAKCVAKIKDVPTSPKPTSTGSRVERNILSVAIMLQLRWLI